MAKRFRDEHIAAIRRVRTREGSQRYNLPIGAPIVQAPQVRTERPAVHEDPAAAAPVVRKDVPTPEAAKRKAKSAPAKADKPVEAKKTEPAPRKPADPPPPDEPQTPVPSEQPEPSGTAPEKGRHPKLPRIVVDDEVEALADKWDNQDALNEDERDAIENDEDLYDRVDRVWQLRNNFNLDVPDPEDREQAIRTSGDYLDQAVRKSTPAIAIKPENLEKVLDEGTFKTLHETGESGGADNPQIRRAMELAAFGEYAEDGTLLENAVYGAHIAAPNRDPGLPHRYGSAVVILHDHLKDRSTATAGDSLSQAYNAMPNTKYAGDPVGFHRMVAFNREVGEPELTPEQWAENVRRMHGFIEAQFHGGVTPADIKEVRHRPGDPLPESLVKKLSDAGIPVRPWEYD